MKTHLCIILLLLAPTLRAADLPTTSLEHLYYLQIRADHVRRFKPDEMVEYCIAQKIGGNSFDSLNAQILTMRIELARLLQNDQVQDADSRVDAQRKKIEMYANLLREEVQKVQAGLIREGQIAADTLQAIARAQNSR